MRWADRIIVFAVAALAITTVVPASAAEPPAYGQVETFQPGKKYNCLPTPDHKGWNCAEIGKSDIPPPPRGEPAAKLPAAEPVQPAAPAATPTAATPASPSPASELPSYLTNAAASGNSSAPAAAAAVSTNPQHTHVDNVPSLPNPPEAVKPAAAAPAAKPPPAPVRTAPVAESSAGRIPPPAAVPEPCALHRGSAADFLALPGNHYVIELAHAQSEADAASACSALHLPHGEVYVLHLRQNEADQWLLVWASFDDVDAARSARADLPASINAGWPRRIAPLQTEVRRTQE